MAIWCGVYLFLGFASFWMKVQSGVYMPKRFYKFSVPTNSQEDVIVREINVIQNDYLKCDPIEMEMTPRLPNVSVQLDQLKIFIRVSSNVSAVAVKETSFKLRIKCPSASPIHAYYERYLNTAVILQSDSSTHRRPLTTSDARSGTKANGRGLSLSVCPGNKDLVYHIIENSATGVIDLFAQHSNSLYELYLEHLESEPTYLSFNTSTRELHLVKSPDRELGEKITKTIRCKLRNDGQADERTDVRNVTLFVIDVDDNPPFTDFLNTNQVAEVNGINGVIELVTYDLDNETITAKSYRVYTNDTCGLVTVNTSAYHYIRRKPVLGSRIITVVHVLQKNQSEPCTVDVTVEDLMYQSSDTQATNISNKAVHRIVIPSNHNQTKLPTEVKVMRPLQLSLDIAAAKYALVTQLDKESNIPVTNSSTFNITGFSPVTESTFLAVTSDGDVYVNDSNALSRYHDQSKSMPITATVVRTDADVVTEKHVLIINVNDNSRRPVGATKCDTGCSIHNTSENCTASCGLGSPTGHCQWRPGEQTLSDKYGTCSPDLGTCPDGVCSQLESLDFLNCPQDCRTGRVIGEYLIKNHGRGIYKAKGTCWCEADLTAGQSYCSCHPHRMTQNRSRTGDPFSPHGNAETFVKQHAETEVCSLTCKVTIAGSLIGAVAVMVGLAVGCMVYRRRQRRQAGTLKHVGSLVSMNAVPSDYIVDDSFESRGHGNRQTSSPAASHWPGKNGTSREMLDDKWEFPRQYLTLEHAIGEGEFGQVVRAQAFMLRGQEGNTVVAVKMLKPDASGSEYQDLVSEIQLLKEVNHPNVIQLLGVCTQKGPLLAIVEYCELGSLRNFLRCSKFKNKASWENRIKHGNDVDGTVSDNLIDPRNLSCRDLFSFAWQIAKGMDYLASLKIVHRDLAARNVLVTDGMKMKISDFGLSRDVYEADTYLKLSKGRIPVKWMAPESLYAQVYTTKTDIWSYGVVLWEIVTLGASPYPGIPPERLFPLLSTGYRMDRPDDCPEELYAIMQKCWKTEPENRPSFCALKDILDNLLQQNTEYLELSSGNNCLFNGTHSNSDDKPCDNQSTAHSGMKPQYSNVCSVSHCQPNVYVASQSDGYDEDAEDCPEMSKLLGNNESVDPCVGTLKESEIILDKTMWDGGKGSNRCLAHENLTYV